MAESLRLVGEPDEAALELAREGGLRVNAAAAFLGVSRSRIYELLRAGALRSAVVGGRRVVLRASAVRFLASCLEP